ncbi:hypothetical protein BGZ81_004678 [Podila clonocystis]|nr:hypothetical protein BGZ81_004678 [Podila clonocystis]
MAPIAPEVAFDCQNIHSALAPTVPDLEALVNTVGRREYQQLLVISRQYRTLYGVDLATELENRILGSVGSLLAGACMNKVLAEVMYIHRAGKSSRKYETLRKKDTALEVLCEILVGRTPEELHELKEAFTAVYKVELQEHTLSFCKDDEITTAFFVNILKDKEDKPLDDLEASVAEFHKLIEAGDIPGMLAVASTMTTVQFGTLIRGYNAQFKQAHVMTTLDKVIAPKHKEHKGTHLELLRFTIMQSADPGRHVALLMEESMAGLGTNEDQLSRLVVRNRGKFMEKVKAAYHVDYSRTLADRVRGDTSGLYSHLICHLINQTI